MLLGQELKFKNKLCNLKLGTFFSALPDPYSSWQKGAIENANGLVRQYIPKSAAFSNFSQQKITKFMAKINGRPRKKLNSSTTKECFYKNIT